MDLRRTDTAVEVKTRAQEVELYELVACVFEIEPRHMSRNMSLGEDLGADSLDVLALVIAMEERFQLSIPDDVASKLTTLGDLLTCLEASRRTQAKRARKRQTPVASVPR